MDIVAIMTINAGMTHSQLIARLGGAGPVSRKLGIPYKNVHNWTRDDPKRGIPSQYMPRVFQMAVDAGLRVEELTALERGCASDAPAALTDRLEDESVDGSVGSAPSEVAA